MSLDEMTVRAVDTNVLARFLLDDDPVQSPKAGRIIEGGAYITLTVLLEIVWLLESRYRKSASDIAAGLGGILDIPRIRVERQNGVRWALARYVGGADIGDMIHLVAASETELFVTFDRGIAASVGNDTPVPIETLG